MNPLLFTLCWFETSQITINSNWVIQVLLAVSDPGTVEFL